MLKMLSKIQDFEERFSNFEIFIDNPKLLEHTYCQLVIAGFDIKRTLMFNFEYI